MLTWKLAFLVSVMVREELEKTLYLGLISKVISLSNLVNIMLEYIVYIKYTIFLTQNLNYLFKSTGYN